MTAAFSSGAMPPPGMIPRPMTCASGAAPGRVGVETSELYDPTGLEEGGGNVGFEGGVADRENERRVFLKEKKKSDRGAGGRGDRSGVGFSIVQVILTLFIYLYIDKWALFLQMGPPLVAGYLNIPLVHHFHCTITMPVRVRARQVKNTVVFILSYKAPKIKIRDITF